MSLAHEFGSLIEFELPHLRWIGLAIRSRPRFSTCSQPDLTRSN